MAKSIDNCGPAEIGFYRSFKMAVCESTFHQMRLLLAVSDSLYDGVRGVMVNMGLATSVATGTSIEEFARIFARYFNQ